MPYDRQQLTECDKSAIHSVELVIEAMENLQVVLTRRVESLRRSIEFEQPAADYEKAVKDSHMTDEREDLQEALYVLDQRRRESAVAAFRSALDHGVSISELAVSGDSHGKWPLATPRKPAARSDGPSTATWVAVTLPLRHQSTCPLSRFRRRAPGTPTVPFQKLQRTNCDLRLCNHKLQAQGFERQQCRPRHATRRYSPIAAQRRPMAGSFPVK